MKNYVTKYVPDDGRVFECKEQCEEYERTQMSVVEANYNKGVVKKLSGEVFTQRSCDDWVELYYIKDKQALDYLNQYLAKMRYTTAIEDGVWDEGSLALYYGDTYRKHPEHFANMLGNTRYKFEFVPLDENYIGKKIMLTGYDFDLYEVTTKEDLIKDYQETVAKVFEEE